MYEGYDIQLRVASNVSPRGKSTCQSAESIKMATFSSTASSRSHPYGDSHSLTALTNSSLTLILRGTDVPRHHYNDADNDDAVDAGVATIPSSCRIRGLSGVGSSWHLADVPNFATS